MRTQPLDEAPQQRQVFALGLEHVGAAPQHPLALEQPLQALEVGGVGRQPLDRQPQQAQAQLERGPRGDGQAVGGLAAVELDHRRGALLEPRRHHPLGQGLLRGHQGGGRGRGLEVAPQPLVEAVGAGEVVQHALVQAQGPLGEVAARELHQPPAPQRPRRGERAPVGLAQRRQGQPEAGEGPQRVLLQQLGEAGVQLRPRAQQQHLALEGGEPEGPPQRLQRRRGRQGLGGLEQGRLRRRELGGGLEARPHHPQRGHQVALVGLGPALGGGGHGRLTRGCT
ncbi:hypothetical protein Mterra_04105 [Calidithermus terrae]|uniref:Uncharacterized protein n=1 Tax=Calidithermus terrae TaxID=1408545 RepID=A0A399DPG0_9DEIN|nr:hypothetical protein Mterra_04105 [Calidithermus terrae]